MREHFVEAGFVTAVPDTASDKKPPASLTGYRISADQAEDLGALVRYLRRIKGPVWIIVTSRGTISAANAVARGGRDGADGLVLTSSLAAAIDMQHSSLERDVDLTHIRVPTLFVGHARDSCRYTEVRDVPMIARKLVNAPKVETRIFEGGDSKGDPCEAFSHHGYFGIEDEVVDAITIWLKANAP